MEIEDRVTVSTPEGVDLDLVVAGLGSRFVSSLVDSLLQVVVLAALAVASLLVGGTGAVALVTASALLVFVVVPTAFDAFAGGRTPGRRAAGLQLVMADGSTVPLIPAAVRNIVRIVDFLPAFYSVGAGAVLVTPRHQRLGDLAADTLVVRAAPVRRSALPVVPGSVRPAALGTDAPDPTVPGWDLTGVTAADDQVVRSFLARRGDLDPEARARVAHQLASRLEPVVVGPDRSGGDEAFLEKLAAGREARRR